MGVVSEQILKCVPGPGCVVACEEDTDSTVTSIVS